MRLIIIVALVDYISMSHFNVCNLETSSGLSGSLGLYFCMKIFNLASMLPGQSEHTYLTTAFGNRHPPLPEIGL